MGQKSAIAFSKGTPVCVSTRRPLLFDDYPKRYNHNRHRHHDLLNAKSENHSNSLVDPFFTEPNG